MICPECDGTGYFDMRCRSCSGTGCYNCKQRGAYPGECPVCDGDGKIFCGGCGEDVDDMENKTKYGYFCTACYRIEMADAVEAREER